MCRWLVVMGMLALLPTLTLAQVPDVVSLDLNQAKFAWEWEQGSGGPADGFRILCGPSLDDLTIVSPDIPATAREYPVNQVITQVGQYTCVAVAFNAYGTSEPSNAVTFEAGTRPVAPQGFGIRTP